MSAIGSVIVMAVPALSHRGFTRVGDLRCLVLMCVGLPGALGHARELATVGHLPQADPAEPELAVDGLRAAAALASGVATHLELRLAGRLHPEGSLGHLSSPRCALGSAPHSAYSSL